MSPVNKLSKELKNIAGRLEKEIEHAAGVKMAFTLVVYNTEPGSRLNYISNANRAEVAGCLRSLLEGWEAGMPDVPAHEYHD